MDMQDFAQELPEVVDRILNALAPHAVFLVGGFVRESILGGPGAHRDLDLIVDVEFSDLAAALGRGGLRTVPLGERYRILRVPWEALEIDIHSLQPTEGVPDLDARIKADLSGRDLTINAVALNLRTGEVLDPHGGLADARDGLVRFVGRASDRIAEDPLRMLRAIRFSLLQGFRITPEAEAAVTSHRSLIGQSAPERVRDELLRILEAPFPGDGFRLMRKTGLLELVLPELEECAGVGQNRHHALDVFEHTLWTVDLVRRPDPVLRLAALLHDLEKPACKVYSERHRDFVFHGHAQRGASRARQIMRRLRFAGRDIRRVERLVAEHMFHATPEVTPAAVRRWMRRLGPARVRDALRLTLADRIAANPHNDPLPAIRRLLRAVRAVEAKQHALSRKDLAVDGRDLIALGLPQGPRIGRALDALLETVLESPERNDRETLLRLARERLLGAGHR